MKLLNKYLSRLYLKLFFIILFALEVFYVGITLLQNSKDIPDSANLQFLYILYSFIIALNVNLVLSLIISWIVMLVVLVKRNELVAFMALGLSKVRIILPIIFINIIILSIFILMKFTPLAYSKSWQDSILDRDNYMLNSKEAIFVKYNEYYIYMNKLYPELKKAKDIVIYRVDNKSINQIIEAKEGFYKGEAWLIKNPKITTKSDDKVYIENKSSIKTLIGFKPKILDNIYESKEQLSIIDGFKALFLLKEQGVRTEKILINLYSHLTLPLFLIPILVIIYIQTPISSRFFSVGKFVALYIFVALVIWGVNFMLHRLGSSGTLNVEIATFVPIVTLFGIMLYLIYKKGIK